MKTIETLINQLEYISSYGDLSVPIFGIEYDSRNIKPDFCFIAIKGVKIDGNNHIQEAVANGARAIVSELPYNPIYQHVTWIQIKNSRFALSHLANVFYNYPAESAYVVGVTGTNGKTTISSLIYEIYNTIEKTAMIGTLGMKTREENLKTSLTTPESLHLLKFLSDIKQADYQTLVMEVSSVALVFHRTAHINFDQAIFSNFTGDHLDFHKTMEHYFESKLLLFKNLAAEKWAILNIDDPYSYRIIDEISCKYITYGFSEDADIRPVKYRLSLKGINATIVTPRSILEIKSNLIGKVNLSNILAAVASAIIKGIPDEAIIQAISNFKAVKGRLDVIYKNDFTVLIDYAHTDHALETLLKSLKELPHQRIIIVFGAGGSRDTTKRPRMGLAACSNADFVIITSDNPRQEDPNKIMDDIIAGFPPNFTNYSRETDRQKAIRKAIDMANKGDVLVIAGKGHEDYQIFKDRVIHFDDYEVAAQAIKEKHA
jgi:UDP-N-acetylmuramoyl-L-alanyl-D-glutamate--2,6-diaminopimelate ligase